MINVNIEELDTVDGLKLLLNVDTEGKKVMDWAKENRDAIAQLVDANGALLIRGLKVQSSKQFGQLLSLFFGGDLASYTYRSTPRTQLRGNVYTATEYPANQVIQQHNENAYSHSWPNRIGFLCMLAADTGGETPIGDCRALYDAIPKAIRDKFEEKKILYVRNYSDLDLPWSEVFQTEDKAEVESFCNEHDIKFEWLENNGLRTKQVNPAVAIHPGTGVKLWFNQVHLFHVSNLDKEMQETLLQSLGEENLPRNTYYGDGSPIEQEALDLIKKLHEDTKVKFKWQQNDLMLLDNMLFTHGREAYEGNRKVLTGMA